MYSLALAISAAIIKQYHMIFCTTYFTAIDCGSLSHPENGLVTFVSTTLGSRADYSCNTGFVLMGISFRMCELDGSWSGEAPECAEGK